MTARSTPHAARPRPRLATALATILATALAAGCGEGGTTPGADTSPGTVTPPGGPATSTGPATYSAVVVQRHPHRTDAFTQGLFFADGQLYESTGIVGASELRRVDLQSGAVLQRRALPAPYFGEGSVALAGRIYQLTWRHGRAFAYDLQTFAPVDTTTLRYQGQGWGLTTDGESLIMSDSTARLRFVDPRTFAVRRTLDVNDQGSPVSLLNELEWYKGEILANVWMTDQIARIDPKTGTVTGWIDLAGIRAPGERTGSEDVLNGIAYNPATDKLYVTGKWWSTLYEIRLQPR